MVKKIIRFLFVTIFLIATGCSYIHMEPEVRRYTFAVSPSGIMRFDTLTGNVDIFADHEWQSIDEVLKPKTTPDDENMY